MLTHEQQMDIMAVQTGPMVALHFRPLSAVTASDGTVANRGFFERGPWGGRSPVERQEAEDWVRSGAGWPAPWPTEPCPDCDRVGCGPVCPQQGVA